jgi:hypothetical protein
MASIARIMAGVPLWWQPAPARIARTGGRGEARGVPALSFPRCSAKSIDARRRKEALMKVALLSFATDNLGDDLQSVAVSLNLPFVDRLVERDRLANLKLDERHFLLTNSWFTKQKTWPPSKAIDPLFFGFCAGSKYLERGFWKRWLRANAPIGCRDLDSVERLKSIGVAGDWTGCLTLRIGSFLKPVPREERSGVYFVDVDEAAAAMVPAEIRERAIHISNQAPPALGHDFLARTARMAAICDKLRHAELVVTKRLHTALPCVGFGTPVVVLVEDKPGNRFRFSGFDGFVPVRYFGKEPVAPVDFGAVAPAVIPAALDAKYAGVRATLAERLGGAGESRYDRLYRRDRIAFRNDGFGIAPGRVAIDLGGQLAERAPTDWTAETVAFEVESFASFERFRAPVLVQPIGAKNWVKVGTVADLVGAA